MKLEFGCGNKPRKPEFYGVDIRNFPNVKFVCKAWEIDQHVQSETVDEIFSRHFFEHLTYKQADLTLVSWMKVLMPGGLIEMVVPDMAFHIRQWLDPNRKTKIVKRSGGTDSTYEKEAIKGFWGGQRGEFLDTWDIHKSGYDFILLRDLVMVHGFVSITRQRSSAKNLHVIFYKT